MQDLDLDMPALARTFQEDGFVVLRGYLPPPDLEDFKSRVGRLITNENGDHKYAAVRKNLQKHDPWALDYLHNGPHVPVIAALIGDEVVPATFGSFDKRPGKEDRIDPHFDAVSLHPTNKCPGATMWIALDRACQQNGCLHYLRGSHKRKFESQLGVDIRPYEDDMVRMEAVPGDAFIHDARTVHWSGHNQTGEPRRAAVMFYRGKASSAASEAALAKKRPVAKKRQDAK